MHLPFADAFSWRVPLCGEFCEQEQGMIRKQGCEWFCVSFELGVLLSQLWALRFDAFFEQVLLVQSECLARDFDLVSSQV